MKLGKKFLSAAIAVTGMLLIQSCHGWKSSAGQAQVLSVGKEARVSGEISIPINDPVDLNDKLKLDIYEMRSKEVNKFPNLVATTYEPSFQVFGMVTSGKPWWGLYGAHFFGPGQHSIEGPSKESLYLLNPYRLISVEAQNFRIWDLSKLHKGDMARAPLYWPSGPVQFNARERMARVTYNVTEFRNKLARFKYALPAGGLVNAFSLICYNASDFGYRYCYLSPEKSVNIYNHDKEREPIEITQFLHCGGSCGYPGGCNNMSPYIHRLEHFDIGRLPARAYVLLWEECPPNVKAPPDFVFVIDFI